MVTRAVVIVAFEGVQPLDVAGPHEVFAGADDLLSRSDHADADRYAATIAGTTAGPLRGESGLRFDVDALDGIDFPIDTLVIPGGRGVHAAAGDPRLVGWLSRQQPRRIATVCSGPFLAAAAGLITNQRVTTHWARARRLAAEHPTLSVDPEPVYIRDGNVWSSAGVTAGIDLSLALVRDDVGVDIAQLTARWLVMFLHRPANQSQFAAPVWIRRADDDAVRQAQELIDTRPGADHRIGTLASKVAMSPRHFQRRFVEEVGMTPGRYISEIRLEAARRALEQSNDSVRAIAARTGFGSAESMRRTFVQRLGAPPDHYRHNFSVKGSTS